MIIAKLNTGDIIVGIEEKNIEMLKKDMPMVIDLSKVGGDKTVITVIYGEKITDILKNVKVLTGCELPVAKELEELKTDKWQA